MKVGHKVCFLNWYLMVVGKPGKGREVNDCKCDIFYPVIIECLITI